MASFPREAGSPGAAEARRLLAEHFRARGFEVAEQSFPFQPGSLNAFPVFGAGLGWLTLLEIPLLLLGHLPAGFAVVVWVVGLLAVASLAWSLGLGSAIPGVGPRMDANLVITRGDAAVRRWIVAHMDTKAQGHSIAGRLVAVWVVVVAVLGMSMLVALRGVSGVPVPGPAMAAAAGLIMAGGVLAGRGRLRGHSPGARDNATGLLAALTAAETVPADGVGFLLTGAEEFGMVGARAFLQAAGGRLGAEVINLDTLTDTGRLYLVAHDARGDRLARRLAPSLPDVGTAAMIRRLPVGIMVDSLALARGGAVAITVARLSWADLRLMHTPRDSTDGLGLTTAESVGKALAALG